MPRPFRDSDDDVVAVELQREDQRQLLDDHRARSLDVLLRASAHYASPGSLRDTPEGEALLASPRELLVSASVAAAAAAVDVRRRQQERAWRTERSRRPPGTCAARSARMRWAIFPGLLVCTRPREPPDEVVAAGVRRAGPRI